MWHTMMVGGAIAVHYDVFRTQGNYFIKINGTVIYENTANQGSGGAIYVVFYYWRYSENLNVQLDMHNTTIYTNKANNGNGGGIHIGQSGGHNINCKISMVECQFTNNTANQGSGGAIYKLTDGRNVNSMPIYQQHRKH